MRSEPKAKQKQEKKWAEREREMAEAPDQVCHTGPEAPLRSLPQLRKAVHPLQAYSSLDCVLIHCRAQLQQCI